MPFQNCPFRLRSDHARLFLTGVGAGYQGNTGAGAAYQGNTGAIGGPAQGSTGYNSAGPNNAVGMPCKMDIIPHTQLFAASSTDIWRSRIIPRATAFGAWCHSSCFANVPKLQNAGTSICLLVTRIDIWLKAHVVHIFSPGS